MPCSLHPHSTILCPARGRFSSKAPRYVCMQKCMGMHACEACREALMHVCRHLLHPCVLPDSRRVPRRGLIVPWMEMVVTEGPRGLVGGNMRVPCEVGGSGVPERDPVHREQGRMSSGCSVSQGSFRPQEQNPTATASMPSRFPSC